MSVVHINSDVHIKLSNVVKNMEQKAGSRMKLPEDQVLIADELTDDEVVEPTTVSHHPPTEDGGEAYPKISLKADFACTPAALFKLMFRDKDFMAEVREREFNIKGKF